MEEITFTFPENMEKIDKYNGILEFIINRAIVFNNKKYHYFIIKDAKETAEDFLHFQILSMMSTLTNTPLYITNKIKKMPWGKKFSYNVYPVNFLKMTWLLLKKKGLQFSIKTLDEATPPSKNPQLFFGFTSTTINKIAKNIYNYKGER